MKERTKRKDLIIFIVVIILTLIIYLGYITNHYATDTYNIMNKGFAAYSISNSFIDGRIIMGTINVGIDLINLPINVVVILFTLIGIVISCTAVVILKNMMINTKNKISVFLEIIATLIAYVTVFNFMYVENLYFIEAIVMGLSILMYTLAVKEIIQKNKFSYLKAVIFSTIATFAYQGTIGLFIIYGFVFVIIKNKENKKQLWIDLLAIAVIVGVSFIINIIQINMVTNLLNTEQIRLNGVNNILKVTKNVLETFNYKVLKVVMFNSCGLFPKSLMLLFVILTMIVVLFNEIKNQGEKLLIGITQIILITILITTCMCIVSLESYDTGRIHNAMGALIGAIYIYIFCNSGIFERKDIVMGLITIILTIYVIIVMFNTVNLIRQHKTVNYLEKKQCEGLEEYIGEYERENNIVVTEAKYFTKSDKDRNGYFESVPNKSVLTYNGVACSWSSIGTINFYTNRNFKDERLNILENIELFKEYLNVKDNGYNNNFVIIDGVLYYSTFI